MQVDLSERLFRSSTSKDVTADGAEEEEHDNLDQRVSEFKTRILKLQRLVLHRSDQADLANKRLDAVLRFYAGSVEALRDCNLVEADRLVGGAVLDLDFARQLLFSKGKATYREL